MIRIQKPQLAPQVLRERGPEAVEVLCRAFDQDPAGFASGDEKLEIIDSIYGHSTVVEALITAQHRKCCFCERKLLGDVEHFRPKSGYQQKKKEPLSRPGYYWLAYEWSNLFLACGPCNQRFKRNLFPLENPEARAQNHHDDVARERPLMLHPEDDEPEDHIGFRAEIAFARGNSRRGKTTIAIIGLNHQEVIESRRGFLNLLRALRDSRDVLANMANRFRVGNQEIPREIRDQISKDDLALENSTAGDAEYSSMARCLLR